QGLVQEIADLSRSDIEADAFYDALLNKVVQALAALGGAVWILGESGGLQLQYQINLRETNLPNDPVAQMQHGRLLVQVLQVGTGTLVAPRSGVGESALGDENAPANPTDFLLVLAPVRNDQGPQGVVEVFQRTGARAATQRGYLRFLEQMCELAGDYLKAQRLRHFANKQTLWEQLESFTRIAHQTLDVRQTAYSIANEGRRLIGCDRVSVAIQRGHRCRIEAVSGQDLFDKRSNIVALLGKLATAVTVTGEDLWYTGDTSDLAPQVEDALDAYVDESHAKAVAVLPLIPPPAEEEPHDDADVEPPAVVGALIVEQMVDSRPPEGLAQRVDIVRQHSATAIANAQEHENLFLMPLWKTIGKARWLVRARTLPKTIAVLVAIAILVLWLCFWPADFTLEARGKLLPEVRRNIYAGIDGHVLDVLVDHGQEVRKGDPLVLLESIELEKELTVVRGNLNKSEKEYDKVQRQIQERSQPRNELDEIELGGKAASLEAAIESLKLEEEWLLKKQQMLHVESPIDGQVTSWKVRERLQHRPVNCGQLLMEIADTNSGTWELELSMPEHRMGHITDAAKDAQQKGQKLPVTFFLATSPGKKYNGLVTEIEQTAEVRGEEGNTVLIRVAFKQTLLQNLAGRRPGAEVTAKVFCGKAPIGYVWFHDLVGWVRSNILFRL
ncbi:MAG: HlyD family efflux transporter periplasmic adaptor subunit, partial [Pirellulales bacterium]|nr:HlyD family efflux transporter periplasmic adaptor subunit [Pirellulales bacterium]